MKKIFLILIITFFACSLSNSQNSTSSPYSFYGIGSLNFKGTSENRAMGRISVYNDSIHMNFRNPASYTGKNMFSFNNEGINKNIAISPGAGNKIRQWDFEKYLMIAHKLQKNGYNIFFFLGPDEKDLLNICLKNGFNCPEWKNGELISNDITLTMGLAKQMSCLLCNDSGTACMFEFMGVKTLKIFGVTNEKKFSRPGFSKTIQIKDYGFKNLKDFPLNIYENILREFLKSIDAN